MPASRFQPTRPRRARLTPSSLNNFAQMPVSTHAPTKGATDIMDALLNLVNVSTHAPTKGATKFIPDNAEHVLVSTHAPTKGATSPCIRAGNQRRSFNPRAHEGRDM